MTKASQIIHGQITPEVITSDAEKYNLVKPIVSSESGVPNFWVKAIENSRFFFSNERDEAVLKFLRNVRLEIKQDKISFTVFWTFEANPYFNNTELTKSYIYNESEELIKIECSTINWNSNEVNTTKMQKKTQKKSKISF